MGYEEMLTEEEIERLVAAIDSIPNTSEVTTETTMPEFIDLADLDIDVDLLDILF